MSEPYRLKIKIGTSEFEAEGPKDEVASAYALFLGSLPKPSDQCAVTAPDQPKDQVISAAPAMVQPSASGGDLRTDDFSRVFKSDKDHVVSLLRLPKGKDLASDAALLILLGQLVLHRQENVKAAKIVRGLRASGVLISRVDRSLPLELVHAAGVKRGRTYGLNNLGEAKAREILKAVMA